MCLAHRQTWVFTHGQIPHGLHVLHRCDNPPCCNPAHLFLGTNLDNIADRVRKGRSRRSSLLEPWFVEAMREREIERMVVDWT